MSEATISFADHDQIRVLFGARDQYLRQVRDTVGIDVVLRGDELKLHGNDEQIERAVEIFTELRSIIEKTGNLPESEVQRVITADHRPQSGNGQNVVAPVEDAASKIDVQERAKNIRPRSPGQADYVEAIRKNDIVFCEGPAGCGKTYLAVAMAINALRSNLVRRIVLVRPAVEAGEKLGFLPGDLLAKVNPYLRPLLDALNDILDFEQVKLYMENDVIEVIPLAYMRGRTLNNTFVILDEAQNTTSTQMKMFLTRMGAESKIIVTGDVTQIDLPDDNTCGMIDATKRLKEIDGIGFIRMTGRDIVRHRLVRDIVQAYDAESAKGKKRK